MIIAVIYQITQTESTGILQNAILNRSFGPFAKANKVLASLVKHAIRSAKRFVGGRPEEARVGLCRALSCDLLRRLRCNNYLFVLACKDPFV